MRIIIPPPSGGPSVPARFGGVFQPLNIASLATNTGGNGQNRTFWTPFGGWASIENNTVVNSFLHAAINSVGDSGIGSNFPDFWNRGPIGVTCRPGVLDLSYQGELWMSIGEGGNGTFGIRRTNTTAKRILWVIERDAGSVRTAYFVTCAGGGVITVSTVIEPNILTNKQRVTIIYDRYAARASLWYDDTLIVEHTTALPTGAITNIFGFANATIGVGVLKTPAGGGNPQRLSFIGFGAMVADLP